ncbi:MAG: AraC family transcriptional regulator ligand-binding domain-containing protein [Pseudomonadota bacterium]
MSERVIGAPARSLLPILPVRYFVLLCDLLESWGIRSADVLAAANIDAVQFNQPHVNITTQQGDTLVREAERVTGRMDLGFELGRLVKPNSHDTLGYAMISSPTCDHMFRLVSRYYRLITPMFAMSYRRERDTAELSFRPVMAMSRESMRFYQEVIATTTYLHIKSLLQCHPARCAIYLSMQEPAHVARYKELAPAAVHFGAASMPGVTITLDAEQLDVPLTMADQRARNLAEERCRELLQNVREQSSLKEWVSMILNEAEDCQPKLDDLAAILNITTRTLDRYLRSEGTTFRVLSTQIRNARACVMLDEGRLSISQIAYRLGYTDVANFSHAFRTGNNCSPTAFQARK